MVLGSKGRFQDSANALMDKHATRMEDFLKTEEGRRHIRALVNERRKVLPKNKPKGKYAPPLPLNAYRCFVMARKPSVHGR